MSPARQRSDEWDMGKLEAQVGMLNERLNRMEDDMRKIFSKLEEIGSDVVKMNTLTEQCRKCPEQLQEIREDISDMQRATSSDVINLKVREAAETSKVSPALEKNQRSTSYWKNHPKFADVMMDGVIQGFKLLIAAGFLFIIYQAYHFMGSGDSTKVEVSP